MSAIPSIEVDVIDKGQCGLPVRQFDTTRSLCKLCDLSSPY